MVRRECIKGYKGANTDLRYFIGILENASKNPNSIIPFGKRDKSELFAEAIIDK